MKFPEFIIVGGTKCGTTALWYNLDKHPDIHMAMKSQTSIEMSFWRGHRWKMGIEWYKRKFPDNKICGEKTAGYFANKSAFRQINKHIPNVKIIFCMRNPVDRAYSNFQMNKKAGKVGGFNINVFKKRYSNHGKYINFIQKHMLKFFDESQLYISVMERMKDDPTGEMKKVFEFLEVSDLNYPKKIIDGVLLRNRSRKEDVKLSQKEKFYRVWSKHTEVLTGPLRQQLLQYYQSPNKKLFKYLGYEIEEWNK